MKRIKNSKERRKTNKNNNDINENIKIILKIFEIGLIFDFLPTPAIKRLLTSSRLLLSFRGKYTYHIIISYNSN